MNATLHLKLCSEFECQIFPTSTPTSTQIQFPFLFLRKWKFYYGYFGMDILLIINKELYFGHSLPSLKKINPTQIVSISYFSFKLRTEAALRKQSQVCFWLWLHWLWSSAMMATAEKGEVCDSQFCKHRSCFTSYDKHIGLLGDSGPFVKNPTQIMPTISN